MSEDQYSQAFKEAAGTIEAPAGIVAGARRKRRRNRIAGGVLAVALLAVATPLALQLSLGADDALLATPSPTSTKPDASPDENVPPELPSEDTGGLTPQVCADVQGGLITPDNLPTDADLPSGAARVWLCGALVDPFTGAVGPREPLLTDPDRVVDAINSLERPPGWTDDMACTAVGGLTFHVVVDYPDRGRRVIEAETVNCGWVGGWGNRSGGGRLLGELLPMWEAQRQTVAPYTGEPPLCDGFPTSLEETLVVAQSSFLDIDLSDLTRGAVCGLAADSNSYDGDIVQRWLPSDVVERIANGDLDITGGIVNPGLPYLVMLTAHGDPYPVYLDTITAATPWLVDALDDIRTAPFFVQSQHCTAWDEEQPAAELADVVSGVACLSDFAVPQRSTELDPNLVSEIAARFDAEAARPTANYGGMNNEGVTLLDADGKFIHLRRTANGLGLITERGERYWQIPADIEGQLADYGLIFEPIR